MKRGSVSGALSRALHQLIWVYMKWILIVALIVYGASGMYKIPGDAVGVLSRFGKIVEPRVPPGLHYKLPWPVDKIEIVPVKQVKTVAINDFSSRYTHKQGGRSYSFYNNTDLEPYCITGDNNIVAITLVLKYTIGDPVKYLYEMKRPEHFMERCTADLIVHHLARLRIDEVLTIGKKQLEFDLQNALSEQLERFSTGIHLTFLEIKEITPPTKVQQDFDKVINAGVEKKQALNQAQGYLNRIVPEARTEANRLVQEARSYKNEKILEAEGEASRFRSRYESYVEKPEAHREKIYLEFIKSIYPEIGDIRVVDADRSDHQLILPLGK